MIRIRKNKIKVVIECDTDGNRIAVVESIKAQVSEGLDMLMAVAHQFDEVRIAKDGTLHCRDLPVTEPEETTDP